MTGTNDDMAPSSTPGADALPLREAVVAAGLNLRSVQRWTAKGLIDATGAARKLPVQRRHGKPYVALSDLVAFRDWAMTLRQHDSSVAADVNTVGPLGGTPGGVAAVIPGPAVAPRGAPVARPVAVAMDGATASAIFAALESGESPASVVTRLALAPAVVEAAFASYQRLHSAAGEAPTTRRLRDLELRLAAVEQELVVNYRPAYEQLEQQHLALAKRMANVESWLSGALQNAQAARLAAEERTRERERDDVHWRHQEEQRRADEARREQEQQRRWEADAAATAEWQRQLAARREQEEREAAERRRKLDEALAAARATQAKRDAESAATAAREEAARAERNAKSEAEAAERRAASDARIAESRRQNEARKAAEVAKRAEEAAAEKAAEAEEKAKEAAQEEEARHRRHRRFAQSYKEEVPPWSSSE